MENQTWFGSPICRSVNSSRRKKNTRMIRITSWQPRHVCCISSNGQNDIISPRCRALSFPVCQVKGVRRSLLGQKTVQIEKTILSPNHNPKRTSTLLRAICPPSEEASSDLTRNSVERLDHEFISIYGSSFLGFHGYALEWLINHLIGANKSNDHRAAPHEDLLVSFIFGFFDKPSSFMVLMESLWSSRSDF